MRNDDGFIYDDGDFSEDEQKILRRKRGTKQGLDQDDMIDPVTGRKAKKMNILNKKKLSKQEMDEFFLDY